jgi:hypothetical protein
MIIIKNIICVPPDSPKNEKKSEGVDDKRMQYEYEKD